MDDQRRNLGHRMALHLIIEGLLARLFADDPEGLKLFEAELVSAVDSMPVENFSGDRGIVADHITSSVEAVFGGALSRLPKTQ